MAHKAVERLEPPVDTFEDNEDGKVAYVMVYTDLQDRCKSVAFDDKGAELGSVNKDIREGVGPDAKPSVAFAFKDDKDKGKSFVKGDPAGTQAAVAPPRR